MSDVIEKRLEKAESDAEKRWNEVYGGGSTEVQDDDTVTEQVVQDDTKAGDTETTDDTPVTTTEEKETSVVQDPKPPEKTKDDELTYKQKYKTLEGKYRAEVPRLAQEVKQWKETALSATAKATELEKRVTALEEEKRPKVDTEAIEKLESEIPGSGKILNQVIADYEARIAELTKKIDAVIPTAETSVTEVDIKEVKRKQFDSEMRLLGVADWKDIDNDPDFHEWLNDVIPYTKLTRADAVMKAASEFDAETVAKVFLDYKKTLTTKPVEKTLEEQESERQENLKKHLAPKTTATSTTGKPSQQAQTKYTRADYEKFMRESAKGRFIPSQWGGKTEDQVEAMFDNLLTSGALA